MEKNNALFRQYTIEELYQLIDRMPRSKLRYAPVGLLKPYVIEPLKDRRHRRQSAF